MNASSLTAKNISGKNYTRIANRSFLIFPLLRLYISLTYESEMFKASKIKDITMIFIFNARQILF